MKNKKMPMGNEESYLRDLEFLKELRVALKYTNKVNINQLAIKHNFKSKSRKMVSLYNGGVIKKGGSSTNATYEWTSNSLPTLAMVAEMNRRAFVINANDRKKYKKRQEIKTNKITKQLKIENIEPNKRGGARKGAGRKSKVEEIKNLSKKKISIAWGLINIEF